MKPKIYLIVIISLILILQINENATCTSFPALALEIETIYNNNTKLSQISLYQRSNYIINWSNTHLALDGNIIDIPNSAGTLAFNETHYFNCTKFI